MEECERAFAVFHLAVWLGVVVPRGGFIEFTVFPYALVFLVTILAPPITLVSSSEKRLKNRLFCGIFFC